MNYFYSLLAVLALAPGLIASDVVESPQGAIAAELTRQKAAVSRLAGVYRADVTKADAAFGVQEGSVLTVVVVAAQDSTLGKAGVQMGEDQYICDVVTADEKSLAFHDPTKPGKLHGCVYAGKDGTAARLALTTGSLEGLSSLEATLTPIQQP